MQNNGNLLGVVLQQALQHAHPSPLPANEPIIVPLGAYGGETVTDSVTVSLTPAGGFTWGSFTWGQQTW